MQSELTKMYLNNKYLEKNNFSQLFAEIFERNDQLLKVPVIEVANDIILDEKDDSIFADSTIKHVAFYCGDYVEDQTIDLFYDYIKASDKVKDVEYGPSYISPKEYNTPGWWLSLHTIDDKEIELFSCKSFGEWKKFDVLKKDCLMSHIALSMKSLDELYNAVNYLDTKSELHRIMLTENDSLGHTYAHYLNKESNHVFELLYEKSTNGGC